MVAGRVFTLTRAPAFGKLRAVFPPIPPHVVFDFGEMIRYIMFRELLWARGGSWRHRRGCRP